MRDDYCPEYDETKPTGLDQRLRSLAPDDVPKELLSRCLATIDLPGEIRRPLRILHGQWISRVATAAAALVLICSRDETLPTAKGLASKTGALLSRTSLG